MILGIDDSVQVDTLVSGECLGALREAIGGNDRALVRANIVDEATERLNLLDIERPSVVLTFDCDQDLVLADVLPNNDVDLALRARVTTDESLVLEH